MARRACHVTIGRLRRVRPLLRDAWSEPHDGGFLVKSFVTLVKLLEGLYLACILLVDVVGLRCEVCFPFLSKAVERELWRSDFRIPLRGLKSLASLLRITRAFFSLATWQGAVAILSDDKLDVTTVGASYSAPSSLAATGLSILSRRNCIPCLA